jgi:hypothetical protein
MPTFDNKEVVTTREDVTIVLSPEVWASLPWCEEGHPDADQIEVWYDLERRE